MPVQDLRDDRRVRRPCNVGGTGGGGGRGGGEEKASSGFEEKASNGFEVSAVPKNTEIQSEASIVLCAFAQPSYRASGIHIMLLIFIMQSENHIILQLNAS